MVIGQALREQRDEPISSGRGGRRDIQIDAAAQTCPACRVLRKTCLVSKLSQGERANNIQVVLNCGYFADSFADCLETYGAKVTQVKAEIGGVPSDDQIVQALKSKPKLITITHGAYLFSLRHPLPLPVISRAGRCSRYNKPIAVSTICADPQYA